MTKTKVTKSSAAGSCMIGYDKDPGSKPCHAPVDCPGCGWNTRVAATRKGRIRMVGLKPNEEGLLCLHIKGRQSDPEEKRGGRHR